MPKSIAVSPQVRCALFAAALIAAPALVSAQGRADAVSRVESVVITVPSVRVRSAPSITSLSIDEFAQGSVFPVASDEWQSADWVGVIVDSRIAFVPRFAVAPRQRQTIASAPAPASAAQAVTQAGRPAPVARAPIVAPHAQAPTRAGQAESAPAPAPAPARVVATAPAAAPAPPTAAPAPAPTPVERDPVRAPEPVVAERAQPAAQAATPETPAAEKEASPIFRPRRPGLNFTVGVLGSVTAIESNGLPSEFHVMGASFVGARYRMLGVYVAPELGQGGGYKSTTLEGGVSLDLVRLHLIRITALGGYLRYAETPVPADSTMVPVTRSLQGYALGGMVSLPFAGPLRLAYRGQYDTVRDAGVPVHRVKHSVGLVF